MLNFRSRTKVFIAALCITFAAFCIVRLHVYINYPVELQSLVRVKAGVITLVITFPLSFSMLMQARKNFLLSEELKDLVNRDRLTDLATRDLFFQRMQEAPDAYGVSLMVDIDHFKRINDTYGHLAGDHVIAAVGRFLRDHTREGDIVCRFGGEEFMIFLYDRNLAEGHDIAERMRDAVAQMPMVFQDVRISVTVSIGGSVKDRIDHIDTAIQAADAALYRAKRSGRNTTVFGDDHSPLRQVS